MYRRVGQELHGGFPRYEHASSGRQLYCYHADADEEWFVNEEFTPDTNYCDGYIDLAGGEVPVGAQAWQCTPVQGKWEERTVTVRELVRAAAPLRLVLRCCSLYSESICRWSSFVWR